MSDKELAPEKLNTAYPGMIWVIEVEYKRRKGRPVEAAAITTGGMLQAMFLAKEIADRLRVPQSWVNPVLYRKCQDKPKGQPTHRAERPKEAK